MKSRNTKNEGKIPSGVFVANKPEEVLSELGVWSPSDFRRVLETTNLSEEEKKKQFQLFMLEYKDAVTFFGEEMEIDMNKVATVQRGGDSKRKRPRRSSGSLSQLDTDVDEPTKCVLANGEEVAEGDVFAVCERIKNEMKEDTTEQKLVKRAYENAIAKCKQLGLTGAEFMTCVETKKKEMEILIRLQEQVMENMRLELTEIVETEQKADSKTDSQVYNSMMEKTSDEETKSWISAIINSLWSALKWTTSKTYSLVSWILARPRVAKLVFIFIKQGLKTMCQYIQLNWIRNIKVVYQEPKTMFQTLEEFRANFIKNYMPLLITEGSRYFMDLGGFEFSWNMVSIATSGALTAMLGFIPGIGPMAISLSSMIGAVMRESCKVTFIAALELADIDLAFANLKDVIIMLLPIEFYKENGQFAVRWNKKDPDSCWTIMTAPILVQGPMENPLKEQDEADKFRADNANIAGVQQTAFTFQPIRVEPYFDPKQREQTPPRRQPDNPNLTRVVTRPFDNPKLNENPFKEQDEADKFFADNARIAGVQQTAAFPRRSKRLEQFERRVDKRVVPPPINQPNNTTVVTRPFENPPDNPQFNVTRPFDDPRLKGSRLPPFL